MFQPELAAIPLGNFIRTMKMDCGTLSHIPALVVKGTNSQTSWICACKIKAGASIAFLLCHRLDIQKQPKTDGWFHFPSVFPTALEFHPAGESQETFSSVQRRYPALAKTNCHLNTQITTEKSLPVWKHSAFKKFTIQLCHP